MTPNWVGAWAQEILNAYMDSNLEAKLNREREYNACLKIQTTYRRFAAQQLVRLWRRCALFIQRVYRGHLGREWFHECRRRKDKELRMAYFFKHATKIQSRFRGNWSRQYILDYYARKAFLLACVLAGNQVKALLIMSYKLQNRDQQQEAAKKMNEEMEHFFSINHHRMSTRIRKGVFYSSFAAIFGGGRRYLEEHVRETQRKAITGMKLAQLDGYNEDGIPIKQQYNKFFIKSSKALHSKMSLDTHRRVQEAANLNVFSSTHITAVGIYQSQYDFRRQEERKGWYLVPHEKDFCPITTRGKRWWTNMGPTIRCQTHYDQRKWDRKQAKIQELEDHPVMVEHPWNVFVPSGYLFESYVAFDKVFPKQMNHHHWPKYSLHKSLHWNNFPH